MKRLSWQQDNVLKISPGIFTFSPGNFLDVHIFLRFSALYEKKKIGIIENILLYYLNCRNMLSKVRREKEIAIYIIAVHLYLKKRRKCDGRI